jgi:hypothetical protein
MPDPSPAAPDPVRDLAFIRDVMRRTEQRVDPHAFHYVHWGLIVLVWYPLANAFELQGRLAAMTWLGVGALVAGMALSMVREARLQGASRLEGDNTFVARQVSLVTFGALALGVVLTVLGPATGFLEGRDVPTLWGIVYAVMAYMIGVVYRREFLYGGLVIFAAVVLALFFPRYNGFLVGPAMGLGMIVPGLRAELRVRALAGATGA